MKERKLGKLRISSGQLLTWLDFTNTNAEIRHAQYNYESDTVELLLAYTTYQDAGGNRVIIRDRGS